MNPTRLLVLAGLAWLGGCAQPPPGSSPPPPPPLPVRPPPAVPAEPVREAPPAPPEAAAAPASPAQRAQAQAAAQAAALALEQGNEEQARAEIQRALAMDAGHRLALLLRRQVSEDPVAMLGRDSFAYTARAGESMSALAGRFLGDVYLFYALARYNGITVPRQLAAGQVLKIPGKAPPAVTTTAPPPAPAGPPAAAAAPASAVPPPPPPPPPAPAPADVAWRNGEAAERSGELDRALGEFRKAAGLGHPLAAARADRVQKALVARHTNAARSAFARQDLDGAIRGWERALAVDPTNDTARLELQRCRYLKEKVSKLPDKP